MNYNKISNFIRTKFHSDIQFEVRSEIEISKLHRYNNFREKISQYIWNIEVIKITTKNKRTVFSGP